MRQSWDIGMYGWRRPHCWCGGVNKNVSSKRSTRMISVQVGTTFWLNYSWNNCMKEKLQPSSSSSPTFTRHTLCQHFLSSPTLPQVIFFLLSHSFLPSSIKSTSWLSHPVSLPPLFFYPQFLSLSTTEKRRQMTQESRLTDSCCQNTSIRHTYISSRRNERTHIHTHTQVKLTRRLLLVSWEISTSLCTQTRKHIASSCYLVSEDCFLKTCFSFFKLLNTELLWHWTVVNLL